MKTAPHVIAKGMLVHGDLRRLLVAWSVLIVASIVSLAVWFFAPWGSVALLTVVLVILYAKGSSQLFAPREVNVAGELDLSDEVLSFGGEPLCKRAQIELALLIPRPGRRSIVFLRRSSGRPIRFEAEVKAEGRALVAALGFGPRQSVTAIPLPMANPRMGTIPFARVSILGLLTLLSIPGFGSPVLALAVAIVSVSYVAWGRLARRTLHVGTDGLRIHRFGKQRFIRHGEVKRTEVFGALNGTNRGIELTLRSGEVLCLPIVPRSQGDGGLAAGLLDLLQTARESAGEGVASDEAVLARGDRPAADWLRAMRALAISANADHRTAPFDPERAWRVLDSPAARASSRVGAAALLATIVNDGERARLQSAAQAIAAPPVRIAIDVVARGGEDGPVLEALDAVHDTETEARAAR